MKTNKIIFIVSIVFCLSAPLKNVSAEDRSVVGLKDFELKVCSSETCKVTTIDSNLYEEFLAEALRASVGKQLRTCQYSIEKEVCLRSFISFASKGINIFEGRAGFTGFRVTDDNRRDKKTISVDIDNYPWVFGTDLTEDNFRSASHQRCDSSALLIESKEKSLVLALRDYQCRGRVYSFQKNFLLTLRRIDTDSGQFLFSYYIDIRDGATGSGTGYTTLELGSLVLNLPTLANLKNAVFPQPVSNTPLISNADANNIESAKSIEKLVEKIIPETIQNQVEIPSTPDKQRVTTQPTKKEERRASTPKSNDSATATQSKPLASRDTPADNLGSSQRPDRPPQKGESIFTEKALEPLQKKDTRESIRVRNPLEL